MTKPSAAAAILMLVLPFSVLAQQPATVGELIENGGKRLGQDELRALLSGATVRGIATTNPSLTLDMLFRADGTLQGLASRGVGRGVAFWGKWFITEQADGCLDMQVEGIGASKVCGPYFQLRGTYYTAAKDEKSSPVYLREIKR